MQRVVLSAKVLLACGLLAGSLAAEMTVEKSGQMLSVSSDLQGATVVRTKVIAPDDSVVLADKYEGSRFVWTPSGADGTYRYDVRIEVMDADGKVLVSDYAGGLLDVHNGSIDEGER